jgi:hypothetical protein
MVAEILIQKWSSVDIFPENWLKIEFISIKEHEGSRFI